MRLGGLLIDLDGTLYVGDRPVPGAREAVETLKASGLALRYVTNTTRKPRRLVRERMLALGFEVEESEISMPARPCGGLAPPEVGMVGDDAEADVVGAKRAGLLGIQVRTGKCQAGVETGEADLTIDSFADLPEVLELERGDT